MSTRSQIFYFHKQSNSLRSCSFCITKLNTRPPPQKNNKQTKQKHVVWTVDHRDTKVYSRVVSFLLYGKITEIENKTENTENCGKPPFCDSEQKIFSEYFKVKFVIKNLRLVTLLLDLTKKISFYLSMR